LQQWIACVLAGGAVGACHVSAKEKPPFPIKTAREQGGIPRFFRLRLAQILLNE
jgi:hypothetical protein